MPTGAAHQSVKRTLLNLHFAYVKARVELQSVIFSPYPRAQEEMPGWVSFQKQQVPKLGKIYKWYDNTV